MFDLRYHVASLAAVFIALVIGILVGVGLSGRGVLRETERINYEVRIDQLERSLAEAEEQVRSQDALEAYERETYPVLMENRLAGQRVARAVRRLVRGRARRERAADDRRRGRQPGAARAPGPDPDG